jgi:septal ring factor EnvC (AmiA/AmiB activator)
VPGRQGAAEDGHGNEVTGALLLAVAALIVAPLVGYVTATRKLSGKINTSEASKLWDESSKIRDDYRDQIAESNKRTVALEGRVATLEHDNNELARENIDLVTKVRAYEAIIAELRARLEHLEQENTDLRELVTALQVRLGQEKEKP